MNNTVKKIRWWFFAGLSILVGLYPLLYFILDRHFALLSTKTKELLADNLWNVAFYTHIILGGIALCIGWIQFSTKFRKEKMDLHRKIGKLYILCVLMSGTSGIYIAQFATGGITNIIAFTLSAVIWLGTTYLAYSNIKIGKIKRHQEFMIYSYAICFSAVTLRFWLPILVMTMGDFFAAYKIVGWLSWVPNLIVAYFIIRNQNTRAASKNLSM